MSRGGKRPGAGAPRGARKPAVPATAVRLAPELDARVRALRDVRGYSLPEIVRAGVDAIETRLGDDRP